MLDMMPRSGNKKDTNMSPIKKDKIIIKVGSRMAMK
jgi:hypothetical protein